MSKPSSMADSAPTSFGAGRQDIAASFMVKVLLLAIIVAAIGALWAITSPTAADATLQPPLAPRNDITVSQAALGGLTD